MKKELIKDISMFILMILLSISFFIGLNENKKKDDARYKAIVTAFEEVNKVFQDQQNQIDEQKKLIEQYERDCGNIVSKVVNGEW